MRLKSLAANLALLLASLLFTALLLEFGVFRLLLPASDLPHLAWENGVIKHQPGDTGVYRVRDEIAARFRINAQGWNSGHAAYQRPRTPGTKRIAVIGDSYVEALQVDYDKSFAELLEARLSAPQHPVEVYRFGIGGAPLSQYLQMLRREVLACSPDMVVLNLVHNDFSESYRFKPGAYTSSFLKLDVRGGIVRGEIAPRPWRPAWYEPLRRSATWRYLAVRRGFSFGLLRDLVLGAAHSPGEYQANIDVRSLDADAAGNSAGAAAPQGLSPDLVAATRFLLAQFQELARVHGFTPVVLMDGNRSLIESQSPDALDYDQGALRLNKLVRTLCSELKLPLLDLHPVFLGEFAVRHRAFGHAHDAHWNAYAHEVVADSLADFLRDEALLY